MFMNEYSYTLDAKGRLSIPAKFRQILEEKKEYRLIVTRGIDGCLFIFPGYEWQIWENKIKNLPLSQADSRSFQRILLSHAFEAEVNKQGRILIPNNLRNYAGIIKDVVIIGVGNRIEIWDKSRWEEYEKNSKSIEEIAEKLGTFV